MSPERTSAPTPGRYGRIAMALHWLMALFLPTQVALGWYMLSIEDKPGSSWYFALHVSLGLTLVALVALRVAWRLSATQRKQRNPTRTFSGRGRTRTPICPCWPRPGKNSRNFIDSVKAAPAKPLAWANSSCGITFRRFADNSKLAVL